MTGFTVPSVDLGPPPDETAQESPAEPSDSTQGTAFRPAEGGPSAPPWVSLPKGGGAIRDIGEKFTVNVATGTASLMIPLATSPGRAGFGPSLSLSYDSGTGNGPFGLGWTLSLPAITRKTDQGLPRYEDDPDRDTFILSGAEDLVPVRVEREGVWKQVPELRTVRGRDYAVQRYRPRIEGLFARIERWRDLASGETHWRTISSGNTTTIYGATPRSRIADPDDPARVFSWLICASHDDTGNAVVYEYLSEDSANVDTSLASECNRTDRSRSARRYLKRVRYGNRTPWAYDDEGAAAAAGQGDWMFEVVLDYGDHDVCPPEPEPSRRWPCRPDPFSTYRPRFEVRTYRRCHRVLMFHHFPAEQDVGTDCLVSSTSLTYESAGGSGMTTLAALVHTGYRRGPGGGYTTQSLPPLELRYSRADIGHEVRDLRPDALENLPVGIDGAAYQWVDLDGVGVSGILARQAGAWFYKANLGDGRFAPPRILSTQPAMAGPGHREELLDLAGDGHLDLVELGEPMSGFYERTCDRGWRPFRPFPSQPHISWDDPNLRLVDLDGDGLADVLITGDDAFTWYPSLGYGGFGRPSVTFQPWDEERGPRLVFADPEQTIYLADMTGDGLSDLVRVRNGAICYWPNVGFGQFGVKVTMDHSPYMDQPDHFDQRRVRLADVDGSGTTDLVYLHADGARLYLNQSGNGFGEPHTLPHRFPRPDTLAQVMVADLLGRGTSCLVWSSPLPGESGRQVRYVDLMAAGKPYLLAEVDNNLGAETRIGYAPSTQFYLADQAAGQPWVTRLPFPVHVVDRVVTIDRINCNRFTTRYSYHHGYYDGFEREFRGFGMVEQEDTEQLAVLEADGVREEFANLNPATDLPPVLTRTWLHTGVFVDQDHVTRLFEHEYYRQPGGGDPDLPDTRLPETLRLSGEAPRPWRLSWIEAREACRALKGSLLREEVYALDGGQAQDQPYVVTEHNYTIELLQPATEPALDGPQNYHAVFMTHSRESVTAQYERALYRVDGELRVDPRITHDFVFATDDFGNPLSSASAGYGRRFGAGELAPDDQRAQRTLRLTHTENRYTNPVDIAEAHRTPLPCETRTYEVLGLAPGEAPARGSRRGRASFRAGGLFGFAELRDGLAAISAELAFQDWDADPAALAAPAHRLTSRTRVRYRRDDLSGPLQLGVLEPLALPYRSYRQAFTGGLVSSLYEGRVDRRGLADAGYIRDGDTWWLPSGRVHYSPGDGDGPDAELGYARRHFFLPCRFLDPFGNTTTVTYDRYDLLVSQIRDALGNLVTAGDRDPGGRLTADGNDYRVLAPWLVSDPNRNRDAVAYDALGRVSGVAVMGKPEQRLGDSLDGFDPDPEPSVIAAYFADPFARAHRLLGPATTRVLYDLDAYRRTRHQPRPEPAGVAVVARETHDSDLAPGQTTKIQRSFTYSDGFGREVQRKGQAPAGAVTDGGPEVERRWIGSSWTVFNNKGKPVRSYEPFFTPKPQFEFARAVGVSPVFFYDPVGRVVAILRPDDTYTKTVFDPWHQDTWDANDTVLLDPRDDPDVRGYAGRYLAGLSEEPGGWATWYARRIDGSLGPAEERAARQTVLHADTPTRAWLDTLGRAFLTVAHNRVAEHGRLVDQYYRTHSLLDIQGNEHEVRDAFGRAVMRYQYTMLSGRVTHAGMDTGGSRLLPDVAGNPVRSWNSRGFDFRTDYDALRRPVFSYVAGPGLRGHVLQTRTEYGESVPDGEARNLRSRVARQYDGAGITTNERYDFKGNPLDAKRQLADEYRDVLDWSSDVPLEHKEYRNQITYDALNRVTSTTTPDGSVMLPSYNESSQLERLESRLRGADLVTVFVAHVDYNARAQRIRITYGNRSSSQYTYDRLTFRLATLTTRRDRRRLQDLRYTYDPVGNPVLVRDRAQQPVFFRNRVVDPSASYHYDALYQLIRATGREHLGQAADGRLRPVPTSASDAPRLGLPQPDDGAAMARYVERYTYDAAGNQLRVVHRSADPARGGWTREYRYREPSLLEPGRHSNRLSGTAPARATSEPERFRYDEQGNIIAMPAIPMLAWDQNDRLHATARPAAPDGGASETSYYVYDASGQRVRKVTDHAGHGGPGARKSERIYVGAFEVYREYQAAGAIALERATLHVLDDKRRVALVETRTAGQDRGPEELIRYQLVNHLDSSVLELDQGGRIITYEEYYAYGDTSYQAVRSRTEAPKRYRYTGKERDTETGLYYHGARYYAPWLGRWTSCDPAGLADGPNLYRYARNNPVTYLDVTGRWSTAWTIVAVVAIVVVAAALTVATAGAAAGPAAAAGAAILEAGTGTAVAATAAETAATAVVATEAAATAATAAAATETAAAATAATAAAATTETAATAAAATAATETAAGTAVAQTAAAETAATATAATETAAGTAAAETASTTAAVATGSTAEAATGAAASGSGLTAAQATGLGAAATTAGMAAQSPGGQAIINNVSEELPVIEGEVTATAESGMAAIKQLGLQGENLAGIDQAAKTRIPSLTGTAAYRIPDALTDTALTEVKNVAKLSFTQQLQDFYQFAQLTGRTLNLIVRGNTVLSGPLQQLENSGQITVTRSLPPVQ